MSERAELYLAIIAFATAAVAVGQLCVVIVAGMAARRVARLAQTVEQELKPIFGNLQAIGRDASRAAALATAQVERADKLFADVTVRIEQAVANVQATLEQPAREGRALVAAFRAAVQAVQDLRKNRAPARTEDEDALFI